MSDRCRRPVGPIPEILPSCETLIAEGDPAVEPLLTALETDMRLTRSVSYGRGMSLYRTVHPVSEAEFAALIGILNTSEFAQRSAISPPKRRRGEEEGSQSTIRAFWMKNRTISLNDRWYRHASRRHGQPRSLARGGRRDRPDERQDRPGSGPDRARRPRAPMKGEALRSRRDPSVSELLARRASEIAGAANPLSHPTWRCGTPSSSRWSSTDGTTRRRCPSCGRMMTKCREVIDLRRGRDVSADPWLSSYVPLFTVLRAEAGDREALDEYAAWFRKTTPEELKYQQIDCFEPMWTYHDRPRDRGGRSLALQRPAIAVGAAAPRPARPHVAAFPLWAPFHVADGAGRRLPRGPDRRDGRQGPDGDGPSRRSQHDPRQDERSRSWGSQAPRADLEPSSRE